MEIENEIKVPRYTYVRKKKKGGDMVLLRYEGKETKVEETRIERKIFTE